MKYETIDSDQIDDIMAGKTLSRRRTGRTIRSPNRVGIDASSSDEAAEEDESKGSIGDPAGQH